MNNSNNQHDEPSHAVTSPLAKISNLWLIPIITALIGIWMGYDQWRNLGPLVAIGFPNAEGLEAGKTKIKTRNIEVGSVESIVLNDALDGVIVTARMDSSIKPLLVEGSKFWVVQPSIGLYGVSGLDTLLSGQYIEFSPGTGKESLRHFKALSKPPLTPDGTPGLHVTLSTQEGFSFTEGDAILFQGFKVGKIEDVHFNFSERTIYYNAFIEAPYHQLVTANTRFWNNTGVRAEMTADGISVETGSIDTLVMGGLSFSLPEGEPPGEQVTHRTSFYIYPNQSSIHEKKYVFSNKYVVLFEDSVSGLRAGSPVLYRGIHIGKVLRTDYIPEGTNLLDSEMKLPIFIEINPGRLGLPDSEEGKQRAKSDINKWLRSGLTATIRAQNFLLGQQLIELNYDPSGDNHELTYFGDDLVIPTGKDSFDAITESVTELLSRLNRLPIEPIGENATLLLDDASSTLADIRQLVKSGNSMLGSVDEQKIMVTLNDSLKQINELASSYSSGSQTNDEIQQLLSSLTHAFTEIRPLLTELNNKPNSLLFTTSGSDEPVPTRKTP